MPEQVVAGCVRIGLTGVNAYLVDPGGDRLVLVDCGLPVGHPRLLLRGIAQAGHAPADVGDILVTHQHIDHAGGLRALVAATGAHVHVHPLDAPEIAAGRPARPASGRGAATRLLARATPPLRLGPIRIDRSLADGSVIEGIRAIHTPGHTAGHTSFLWPMHGGVLFTGDAAANWLGRLGHAPLAEDWVGVDSSIARLAALEFRVAVFGHGRVLRGRAHARFRSFADRVAARAARDTDAGA